MQSPLTKPAIQTARAWVKTASRTLSAKRNLMPSGFGVRTSDFGLSPALFTLLLLVNLAIAPDASGATVTWTEGGGANTNWSNAANWSGGVPGAADDVQFFDSGAVTTASNLNNVADAAFAGTVASLHFGNTNNFHTTLIPTGETLTLSGTNGLRVGTLGDLGAAKAITATITGPGGALVVSNASASVVLNQGTATSVSGSRATLNLSGLDTFIADVSRLGIGTIRLPNVASQRNAGALYLAKTNKITLRYAAAPSAYQTATATNALEMAYYGSGNNGSMPSLLYLGRTNAFFLDSLGCGRSKASAVAAAVVQFDPAYANSNPAAFFRGINGGMDRVSWWAIGDMADNGSSAQTSVGTNDFSGGTLDARVEVMSLGRDTTGSQTTLNANRGVLTFTAGTLDVNTLIIGNQAFSQAGNTAPCLGSVNVNGSNAWLVVNSLLELGHTSVNSPAATNTAGVLNVSRGTVCANTIVVGDLSANNTINMASGTLTVTNTAGTPDRPIASVTLSNAALWLAVTDHPQTNLVATSLLTGGVTNRINLLAVPVFPSYPTQVTLLKYTGAIAGTGYNFGLGSLPGLTTGFLVNNAAKSSVDFVVTGGAGTTIGGLYFQQQPTATAAGAILAPAVRVVVTNLDGSFANNATVVLALASGTGALNGTLSQPTDASGTAAFGDLSMIAPGAKQLVAAAGGSTALSAGFTITPGAAVSLAFSTQPSDTATNQSITPAVVVQLLDAYTNAVGTNGLPVTMTLSSGTGALTGTTNVNTDANGRATFANLRLTLAGAKQLTASSPGLTSAASVSFSALNLLPPTPAFPGAEGAGAYAFGGRGGDVYYVTTLADTGAGSFRTGISGAPASGRTICFKVSGNIVLNSTMTINKPNITVAGQTAPGDGICFQNYSLNIAANNIIVRHVRTRLGTNALQEADAMWINSGTNIIVDHLSASWSVDETLSSSTDVANLTVQNCFITESLQNSIHSKGAHGYGGIISSSFSTTYSYLRNLYAHHDSRNPRVGSDAQAGTLRLDFRNNVIYNWGFRAGYSGATNENSEMNYVGNYLIAGPSSTSASAFLGGGETSGIYQSGNFMDTDKDGRVDGANTGWVMFTGIYTPTNLPYSVPAATTESAGTACQRVLAQSGAMPWHRDANDQRITRTVRLQTGTLVDFVGAPNQPTDYITNAGFIGVRGWPALVPDTAPADTDSDGMPNYWELAMGLNPNSATDRNTTNSLGYTRLEDYLNWLADPHALCDRNGQVDVDLRQINGGATNLTFTVASGANGSASLRPDGFTARFISFTNYSGLANFSFTATDPLNAVSFGPVAVNVLISITNAPNTPPALAAISNRTLVAGLTLTFTNTALDTDQPPQAVTFTLLGGPAGASVNATSGIFTWRPTIAQGGTTNPMRVVATDSGIPSQSATQAFTAFVTKPASPMLSQTAFSNGEFSLRISGDSGPDYSVQATTNLAGVGSWTTIFTTNAPALPFRWTDTGATNFGQRFYRILLGP